MSEAPSNNKTGLSEENINLIVGTVLALLLFFGPIDSYRILYLIGVPVVSWLGLNRFGKKWGGGRLENDRLNRGIVGLIAGALFVAAFQLYSAPVHSQCAQYVRSGEGGYDCVGDYVAAPGRDLYKVVVVAGLGCAAAWYAVFRRD